MTQEIVDAVREIEREKGIETGTLVAALEDALLAAYKKTPGAARHATVELDDQGDFRVYSIELPADLEERLLDEARERALDELERIEQESGERTTRFSPTTTSSSTGRRFPTTRSRART
jgi:N utilization substance protein A